MNKYQATVLWGLGWFSVLFDGWLLHSHWLAALGVGFLIYSTWRIFMKTDEDEEFERIEREQSMAASKREPLKTNQESFDDWEHSHRPDRYWIENRAYIAGFNAGERNERMKKELND